MKSLRIPVKFDALLSAAKDSAQNAHAPYSNFRVGAALLCSNGDIYTGCNVENASYGLTICAERNAIFSAIAAGQRDFVAMSIVADGESVPFPCGACRQVLSEFCGDDFSVCVATGGELENHNVVSLAELLPHNFKLID
jgi:cytidine deaminase